MQKVESSSQTQTRIQTFDLIATAMMAALIFVATNINFKLPFGQGGLIHLGTAMLFIASLLFGPKKGAIAGALGMGIFDVLGGWLLWAPITLVARFLQGLIVGKIAWSKGSKGDSLKLNILASIVSMPVMIGVYYIGQAIMFKNWVSPVLSIPGDITQNVIGLIIAIPVVTVLKKVPFFQNL